MKAVKFLPSDGDASRRFLLSGSDDQTLKLWQADAGSWTASCVQTLEGHTAGINCIECLRLKSCPRTVVVSGAADATIRVWTFEGSEFRLAQTLKLEPRYFPLTLALSAVGEDGEGIVLAAAGTRPTIQVYVGDEAAEGQYNFKLQATLAGHEDWIRSLDFTRESDSSGSDLLLASGSQDKYIRLWRFHQGKQTPHPLSRVAATDAESLSSAFGTLLTNKTHRLKTGAPGSDPVTVTFEALLFGHDDWVYSTKWEPSSNAPGSSGRVRPSSRRAPRLLSASADNTLAVWAPDGETGIWVTTARLGEVSREKGATTATGSAGGFWTGLWCLSSSTRTTAVVCLVCTGSWRRWVFEEKRPPSKNEKDDENEDEGEAVPGNRLERGPRLDDGRWRPDLGVTGHSRAVTGISWSAAGEYLLSTSLDQTTRLHARWTIDTHGPPPANAARRSTWHEMARPQIHGYDINCIDYLPARRSADATPLATAGMFVSGADEKLMRVFRMPAAVAGTLRDLAGAKASIGMAADVVTGPASVRAEAERVDVPVLGLSNKAVDIGASYADGDSSVVYQADGTAADPPRDGAGAPRVKRRHPPLEDELARLTLFPEVEKLYGHGYELSCLACSPDGSLIASACRASSANHAVIRIFDTKSWSEIRPPLKAHSLTVTRLRWLPSPSPAEMLLLSVGRDRQWAVWGWADGDGDSAPAASWSLVQANASAHSRMILDAVWAPLSPLVGSAKDKTRLVFATAGRDKLVKVWARGDKDDQFALKTTVKLDNPVTAIDFLSSSSIGTSDHRNLLLATGTENGGLYLYSLDREGLGIVSSKEIDQRYDFPLPASRGQPWDPLAD